MMVEHVKGFKSEQCSLFNFYRAVRGVKQAMGQTLVTTAFFQYNNDTASVLNVSCFPARSQQSLLNGSEVVSKEFLKHKLSP